MSFATVASDEEVEISCLNFESDFRKNFVQPPVPAIQRLPEAIHASSQPGHQLFRTFSLESWRLPYVDFFVDGSVDVGEMMDMELPGGSSSEGRSQ